METWRSFLNESPMVALPAPAIAGVADKISNTLQVKDLEKYLKKIKLLAATYGPIGEHAFLDNIKILEIVIVF